MLEGKNELLKEKLDFSVSNFLITVVEWYKPWKDLQDDFCFESRLLKIKWIYILGNNLWL